MKVKVIKTFRDKNTRALCRKGRELDVSEKRFREINATKHGIFLEVVKNKKSLPTEPDGTKEETSMEELPGAKDPEDKVSGKNEPADKVSEEKEPVEELPEVKEPVEKVETVEEILPEKLVQDAKEELAPKGTTDVPAVKKKKGKKEGD